jgi:hypothetical protein
MHSPAKALTSSSIDEERLLIANLLIKEGDCTDKGSCNDAICFRKSKYGRCTFVNGRMGINCIFITESTVYLFK